MGCPDETTLSDFLVGLLPEERRAEVLAHVEDCAGCQRALAAGEGSLPPAQVPGEARLPLARGATLSRYVVLERIGQGAMGVVYAAYDPELDRRVALKLLRPEGRHVEELRRRLLREAQALARLSHPNVVAVHDVGTCDDGLFLAMDLVEGTTLAEWLKQPRAWREVLHVFLEAGRGLAAAHAAGLVHRDFKPANVLVGHNGQVRVTDFGLASTSGQPDAFLPTPEPESAPEGTADPLTRTGALLGTPAYMAPEQFQHGGASEFSDQFSFCVALHEALHGERPFQGHSLEALAQAALEERVRPPGREPKVPAWVRHAVLRGLRARPEERFPSMEALLAALTPRPRRVRAWVAASAITSLLGMTLGYQVAHRHEVRCAREADRLAAVWGPEHRERVRQAFLATGRPGAARAWEKVSAALDAYTGRWRELRTGSCLAAAGDSQGPAWQTASCLDARVWQLSAVTRVLEEADADTMRNASRMVDSLEGLASCEDTPGLATRPQPPDALRPRVDEARRKLAEAHARGEAGRYADGLALTSALREELQGLDYRPLEAELLLTHGQLLLLSGKPREAEDTLHQALWAAEAGRDDESAARAWILLISAVGGHQARVEEAHRLAQHARAVVERLGPERFPAITSALHLRLGELLLLQDKQEPAYAELTRGLELARKGYGPDHPLTADLLIQLGNVRSRQLRHEEALALYQQANALVERAWGPDTPLLATNLSACANQLLALGRTREAEAMYRRAINLLEAFYPPDHRRLGAPHSNFALLLSGLGRLEESRQHYQRALDIFERALGPDHPHTTNALNGLGTVAFDQQRYDEAISHHQRALERLQRSMGPDAPLANLALEYLGLAHLRAGRPDEARRHLLRSLQVLEKAYGPDSARLGSPLRSLARVELATGAPRAALAHCQRARVMDERVQGPEVPDVALDMTCEAEAYLALGAPEEARPRLERARELHARFPQDLRDKAWTSFILARALWERREDAERARAVTMAEEARELLEAQKPRGQPELKEVTAWLARHPAPPSVRRSEDTP